MKPASSRVLHGTLAPVIVQRTERIPTGCFAEGLSGRGASHFLFLSRRNFLVRKWR
jgi:hypothetical protein